MPEFTPLKISTTIKGSIEHICDCWTSPKHVQQWNHASEDWHCPKATNDLRVGGSFSYTMAAKDGSFSFDFEGKYTDVKPLHRISYVMADGRKVTTEFHRRKDKVVITSVFDAENENPLEMQQEGWQSILNNFKLHVLATNPK